jgi:hypothetical protein
MNTLLITLKLPVTVQNMPQLSLHLKLAFHLLDKSRRSVELPTTSTIVALMMEAVRTSETSVCSSETTRRYIPEDSHLHIDAVRTSDLA